MIDQAFDAAKAFGEREEVGVFEEAARTGQVRLQDDGDHAAERAHLFLRQLVLRMLFQAGVVDLLNLRFLLEPARYRERVLAMPFHPERERLQSAQREKA